MKEKQVLNNAENFVVTRGSALICAVLFMGVLLSGTIYFGLSSVMGISELSDDYYDGAEYDFGGAWRLDDIFFRDPELRANVVKYEFLLFGRIDDENIIVGRDGFLFDAFDSDYGYDYVRDYIGEFAVSDSEIGELAKAISQRNKVFEDRGIEYLIAVIPNAQTVYGDKLPAFFGEISPDTRLSRLSERMDAEGADCFLDLTGALTEARGAGQLYNNTENSLNALGAYYAYLAVFEALPEAFTESRTVLTAEELDFYTHITMGRSLAREVGLERLIHNRTVTLPSNVMKKYSHFEHCYDIDVTCSQIEYRHELPLYPPLLIELSDGGEWDKILFSEYFSNTFGEVGYRISQTYSDKGLGQFNPRVVIQFIHENELSALIESEVVSSYERASEKS